MYYCLILSVIETGLGVICSCAPALRALYKHHFKSSGALPVQLTSTGNAMSNNPPEKTKHNALRSVFTAAHIPDTWNAHGGRQPTTTSTVDRGSGSFEIDLERIRAINPAPRTTGFGMITVKSTVAVDLEEMSLESDGDSKESLGDAGSSRQSKLAAESDW